MSTVGKLDQTMTLAQYVEWNRQQTDRHEYYRGEMFSQDGGTRRHSQVGSNTLRVIGNHYRQIPLLKEYLVFWQDEPRFEQHTRTAEGNWLLREFSGLDAVLQLSSLGASLPLREVYDKVDFNS